MLLQRHIIAVFTFSSCRVSVAMLMGCVPCGQQDLDDSFLQHIFNRHLCEVQQHDGSGVRFKYVQIGRKVMHPGCCLATFDFWAGVGYTHRCGLFQFFFFFHPIVSTFYYIRLSWDWSVFKLENAQGVVLTSLSNIWWPPENRNLFLFLTTGVHIYTPSIR